MSIDLQQVLQYLQSAGLLFLSLSLGVILPFSALTILIVYLSSLALKRIIQIGGFRLLYLTAWLGVPIHEVSHAIAALIGGHRIRKFAPFKPNPKSGQLGVLETTYDDKKWWARWVGNAVIPVAPLFGGTVVLFLLVRILWPQFTMVAYTRFSPPSALHIENVNAWQKYFANMQLQLSEFIGQLWQPELFNRWETYVIGYAMLCIALHLSPSITDWKNFRKPLIVIILVLLIGCLVLTFFPSMLPTLQLVTIHIVTWFLPVWLFVTLMVVIATAPIIIITQFFIKR